MSNGFKYSNLTPELQRELDKFKREMEDIQQDINARKMRKRGIEAQLGTQKEAALTEDSQKRQRVSNLDREIQRLDKEIKKHSGKSSPQIKQIEMKIANIDKEIERTQKQIESLRQKEKKGGQGVASENLIGEKRELEIKLKETENKLKMLSVEKRDIESKIGIVDTQIKGASQRAPVPGAQKEIIKIEQEIKSKQSEKEKLEKEKSEAGVTVSTVVDNLTRQKLDAVQEKEKLESELRRKILSPQLQKLENELKDLNLEIKRLEHRKLAAEENLSSMRSRLRSLPPV